MRVVRALVAAALAASLPAPVAAQRGPEGVIAYSRDGIVYVAAPDGSGELPYAPGEWPSMSGYASSRSIVWVMRRGGARVLMKADLTKPARPVALVRLPLGPGRVHVDWWSDEGLVVGLERDGRYEVGIVERPGGRWAPLPVPGVSSPRAIWHDDRRVVVATGDGLVLYDPRSGATGPVGGARPGDVPVEEAGGTTLLVNGRDGFASVDRAAAGTRRLLVDGGYGWQGSLYTRGRDVGYVYARPPVAGSTAGPDFRPLPFGRLPEDAHVLAGGTRTRPRYDPLLEIADRDGQVGVYAATESPDLKDKPGATPPERVPVRPVRKVADGAGLTKTSFVGLSDVRPPAGAPLRPRTTGPPPIPSWAPRTSGRDPRAAPPAAPPAALATPAAVAAVVALTAVAGAFVVARRRRST